MMTYEKKTEATIEDWKNDIIEQLTGDQGDDSETRAVSKSRRYLVGKVGTFPTGDKAFNQMKRADDLVLGGGGGKNARWSLTTEEARIEINIQAVRDEREARRIASRDRDLATQLNLADLPADAAMMNALRIAYEAGRDSSRR